METRYLCDGSCCERFWLPMDQDGLWASYSDYQQGFPAIPDIEMIAQMTIYLEPAVTNGHWYTCKFWDSESRLCTIYNDRPRMCREYPYGSECTHCHSTCGTEDVNIVPAGPIGFEHVKDRIKDDD